MEDLCQEKMGQHRQQDSKAHREIDQSKYITEAWLKYNLCNVCIHYNTTFDVSFVECKVFCNLAADRVNTDRGHELDNILPCCTGCNVRKVKRQAEVSASLIM